MPSPYPLLVSSDAAVAARLRSILTERSGVTISVCDFSQVRDKLNGGRHGIVMLAVSQKSDLDAVSSLTGEARQYPGEVSFVVIEVEQSGDDRATADLRKRVNRWHRWPTAIQCLVPLLTGERPSRRLAASPTERIRSGLRSLTPSLESLAEKLAIAAQHDVTVLLTGETGTGKTFLGKLLHDHSPRSSERLLIVPCGAQPPELFQSAFFGHVKGSFTGAHQTQPGKFASAGKGTILLDEIDTLDFEQQAALLRVIESGEYEMVGSSQTLKSEARLIVTSNTDLDEAVQRGHFRQDLYYRLNVMSFHLPPLRERLSDISMLTDLFVSRFAEKFTKPVQGISPAARMVLERFSWPGNVRQLENSIQRAVLVSQGMELRVEDLPDEIRQDAKVATVSVADLSPNHVVDGIVGNGSSSSGANGSLLQSRADYERTVILKTLEDCRQNRSSAARVLGVSRVTLHKKIKQYGLTGQKPR